MQEPNRDPFEHPRVSEIGRVGYDPDIHRAGNHEGAGVGVRDEIRLRAVQGVKQQPVAQGELHIDRDRIQGPVDTSGDHSVDQDPDPIDKGHHRGGAGDGSGGVADTNRIGPGIGLLKCLQHQGLGI